MHIKLFERRKKNEQFLYWSASPWFIFWNLWWFAFSYYYSFETMQLSICSGVHVLCLSFWFLYYYYCYLLCLLYVREITTHKTMQLYWNELATVNRWLVRCQWQTTQNEMFWVASNEMKYIRHIFSLSLSFFLFSSFNWCSVVSEKTDSYLFNGN